MPPQGQQDITAIIDLLVGIFVQSSLILGGLGFVAGVLLTVITVRRRMTRRPRDIPSP